MSNLIDYKLLKEISEKRKEEFAKMPDENTPTEQFGETYGFHLKLPYTKEELDRCLSEKNITIPVSFYRYLTEVSREIVFGEFPLEICLSDFPTREQTEKITFNNIERINNYMYSIVYQIPNKKWNENKPSLEDIENVMFQIGESRFYSHVIYLGSGNIYGSVWLCDSCNFDDNGTCYLKQHDTFDDFLIYHMNHTSNNKIRKL